MKYYRGAQVRILHPAAQRQGGIISRTGYTGEDGFELSLGAGIAPGVWEVLMRNGQAAGHRARRAGRPRYAAAGGRHAALRPRAVRTDRSVPGRAGIRLPPGRLRFSRPRRPAADPESSRRKSVRIGLEMSGKRAARQGCPILAAARPIGEVTSGSYSPTLGKPIAMGYVAPAFAQAGRRTANRHSRPASSRPAWWNSLLSPREERKPRSNVRKSAVQQDARMGPRRDRSGRSERSPPWA